MTRFYLTNDFRFYKVDSLERNLKMRLLLSFMIAGFIFSGCVEIHSGKRTAPGQIQKKTGYNPASGKFKKVK
jgi:hypothetical protein